MSGRSWPAFRHIGSYTFDPERMAEFYCRHFGLVITDRGTGTTGHQVIFMSGNPHEHHQFVVANGREPGSTPLATEISFRVEDVAALKAYAEHFEEAGIPVFDAVTHGSALSIHIHDPEGNTVEIYCQTPWHVEQPVSRPLDLWRPDDEILAESEALCRTYPSFLPREQWAGQLSAKLSGRIGD